MNVTMEENVMDPKKKLRYYINDESNFYYDMTGALVMETPKTRVLEFKMNESLGGKQRVQFYLEQTTYVGCY